MNALFLMIPVYSNKNMRIINAYKVSPVLFTIVCYDLLIENPVNPQVLFSILFAE